MVCRCVRRGEREIKFISWYSVKVCSGIYRQVIYIDTFNYITDNYDNVLDRVTNSEHNFWLEGEQ